MPTRSTRTPLLAAATCALLLGAVTPPTLAGRAGQVRVRAFESLNEGVAAYKRGDYSLAVARLAESASLALNSFRAHYYLGLAQIGNRQYIEAVGALEIALDLDPDHLQSLVALGDAFLKMGNIVEARAAYARSLKIRPAYPPALDGLARSYEAQSDEERAIRYFEDAIASNKGYAPAYTHLGDLYMRQGDLEEAVRLLEEAIEIRRDYAPGLNRLALAYGRLGLHNEGVATVQEAIELEPTNPVHLVTLGRLQLNQGFVTGAERSFHEALALDPQMPEARAGLGAVAYRRGEFELALAEIDAAIDHPRLDALMRKRLAGYRETIAEEAQEVETLIARVEDESATPQQHARLAELAVSRGLWEPAVELQRGAPDTPAQRERLAYMLFRAGQYREAYEIYSALAETSENVDLRLNTAVSLALLGDDALAAEDYRKVLELDPENRRARIYLGNSLLRLGRHREAAEAYAASLADGAEDEAAERIRRILVQIAPELVPEAGDPPPPRDAYDGDPGR
jgi:tetratricopeptide (TPR) repeat protein